MPLRAIARLVQTMLYARRFFPYYVYNILGGIEEDGKLSLQNSLIDRDDSLRIPCACVIHTILEIHIFFASDPIKYSGSNVFLQEQALYILLILSARTSVKPAVLQALPSP